MEVGSILAQLDSEITRLTKARDSIAELNGSGGVRRGPGRPKGSDVKTRKSGMTEEGRARISAAMKARWANKKKASKKT